jgi:hypothetical protein
MMFLRYTPPPDPPAQIFQVASLAAYAQGLSPSEDDALKYAQSQVLGDKSISIHIESPTSEQQPPSDQTSTNIIRKRQTLISDLGNWYLVVEPTATSAFLRKHCALVPLLVAAYPQLNVAFGSGVRMQLQLVTDPEDEAQTLVAAIYTDHAAAYASLEQFEDSWWLDHIDKSEGLLIFAVRPL